MEAAAVFDSPVGRIVIAATAKGISSVSLRPTKREIATAEGVGSSRPGATEARGHVRRLRKQLTRYFAGGRARFDVPLDLSRGTAFQRAVWRACARIPSGQMRSYADLARMAGRPGAARAVGNAMHNNPVPIVVPCHRVIKSDGSLGGFGSGVSLKKKLLRIEGALQ
jgi:methylated-DNA-[protein]-cysteine S-methyltransferase